jgi:hypothetical protein
VGDVDAMPLTERPTLDEERSLAARVICSEIGHNIEFAERLLEECSNADEYVQARVDAARAGLGRAVQLVEALALMSQTNLKRGDVFAAQLAAPNRPNLRA